MNEKWQELLDQERLGELDAEGSARLDALAAQNPELKRQLAEERALSKLLRRCGPNPAPVGLSEAVFAQLDAEKQGGLRARLKQWFSISPLSPGLSFAAAALLIAAVGGIYALRPGHSNPMADRLASPAPAAMNKQSPFQERQLAMAQPAKNRPALAKEATADKPQLPPDAAEAAAAQAQPSANLAAAPAVIAWTGSMPDASAKTASAPAAATPAATPPETAVAMAEPDARRLPSKLKLRAEKPALPAALAPQQDAASVTVASASMGSAATPIKAQAAAMTQIELSIHVAAATSPASSGFAASAGAAPASAARMRSAAPQLPPEAPRYEDVLAMLNQSGIAPANRAPAALGENQTWQTSIVTTRGQLAQFIAELQRRGLTQTGAGSNAPGFSLPAGGDPLHQGNAADPVKLRLEIQ